MGKSALGKGLGQIMSGQRPAATKSNVPDTLPAGKVTPVDFGRGLGTLIAPRSSEKPAAAPRILLPAWFFFAADLLLLSYTLVICLDAGDSMEIGEVFFAVTSITLGALLAIAGVHRSAQSFRQPSSE